MNDDLQIAGNQFRSRLLMGTGKFSSSELMSDAIKTAQSQLVTVALKRIDLKRNNAASDHDHLLQALNLPGVTLLPNTSGARTAKEAVFAAEIAREALKTDWVKLEIHPNPRHLLPDPIETLEAASILVKKGFIVLPYVHADPILCKRLEDVGVAAVMPLGAPIGSNRGINNSLMLELIVEQSSVPVIVDAGLGAPSHAAYALELGADAVLVNTAIAISEDAALMANAFRLAVEAGRAGFLAGRYASDLFGANHIGSATSPLTAFLHDL